MPIWPGFMSPMAFGGNQVNREYNDDFRIRDLAERRYGGITTRWRVINEVKRVCQKFGVDDVVTIEDKKSNIYFRWKGLAFHNRLQVRLKKDDPETQFDKFFRELCNEVNDCGYKIAVGDNFLEISSV